MKSFIFLLSILALVFSQKLVSSDTDETHGCIIKEKEGKCCWTNNNGCCGPYVKGQICTQAFRTCCKTKFYDEATGEYAYHYS